MSSISHLSMAAFLLVCFWSAATFPASSAVSERDFPEPADLRATDSSHLARIDRLIALSGFGIEIDLMLTNERELAIANIDTKTDLDSDPDAAALQRTVLDYVAWTSSAPHWRTAIAEDLTPAETELVIAYYSSASGRAFVRCIVDGGGAHALLDCPSSIGDSHAAAFNTFQASSAGQAWSEIIRRRWLEVMKLSVCDGLEREPSVAMRMLTRCKRDARENQGVCRVLRETASDVEIDQSACRAEAMTKTEERAR